MRPVVASVGTLHPWNIAGAGLDLLASGALDVRVVTALAAVSAQDAGGVRGVYPLGPGAFFAQLEALPWSQIGAVRVGALPDAAAHHVLADALRGRDLAVVVDPVLLASSGEALVTGDGRAAAAGWFSDPRAILTPNRSEAEIFLGAAVDDAREAARRLAARGARAVIVKGGHFDGGSVSDVVAEGQAIYEVTGPRLDVEMRGTGCLFAIALAAALAHGVEVRAAVERAHAFVHAALRTSSAFAGVRAAY